MLLNFIGAFLLMIFGLYMMVVKKNLIKIIMGMALFNIGLNLLTISIAFNAGGAASIFFGGFKGGNILVDPIPQVITITSILIGACVTAITLSLVIKVKAQYGTIDSDKTRGLNG